MSIDTGVTVNYLRDLALESSPMPTRLELSNAPALWDLVLPMRREKESIRL
jgi:hypothetical protein